MEAVMEEIRIEKYPAYKDSGVEWLGEIPEHWDVSRLGKILTPTSIKNQPELPLLSITREKGVIMRNDDEEENHNFIPDDLSNYKVLRNGEFGMNKMKAWQGSYGISSFTGIVSPAYYTFITDPNIVPEFFHLAIRSKLYVSFFGSASDGVRVGQWDLSKDRMKNIPFLIPSIEEQRLIATFLKRKMVQIEEAIGQKQKLIDLLKERRQILIHNAVTRGLDPNVPMKDSGVEWIGEIPEHWTYKSLKHLVIGEKGIQTGPFGTQLNSRDLVEDGIKILNQKTLIDEEYHLGEEYISYKKFNELSAFEVYHGDIIMGARGSFGTKTRTTFGKCSIVPEGVGSCVLHPSLIRIRPDESQLSKEYFKLYVNDSSLFLEEILNTSNATTIEVIYGITLRDIKFPVPPLEEQIKIMNFLNEKLKAFSQLMTLEVGQIEKLKEYKATLINAAATGKIKVG